MALPNSIHLIPVALRDASQDSPVFRATVIRYTEQADIVEKWMDGYTRALTRLVGDVDALEDVFNTVLQKSVPSNITDLVMDQDYTATAMKKFTEGSREIWWNFIAGAKKLEQTTLEPLQQFQREELRTFKEARRNLDVAQGKYDSALSKYLSQSKTKEPSALREDAFQLYEARKAYLRASLDFCVAAANFHSGLDRTVTKIATDQWRENYRLRSSSNTTVEKYKTDMERVRSWSDTLAAGEKTFKKQMLDARKELEELVKRETMPARDLDEYSATTVPFLNAKISKLKPDVPSERQGWLFIKLMSGKPARTIWTRRWFFLKDGIFGSLAGGARNGNIEQSEKIGVLLCNVKAAFTEERRFCFEVKTKDNTVMLQAETQADLTSWIETFEQAKRTALESSSQSGQAFAIIPSTATVTEAKYHDVLNIAHFHEENVSLGFDKSISAASPPLGSIRPSMDTRRPDDKSAAKGGGVASLIAASHGTLQSQGPPIPGVAHAATFSITSLNSPSQATFAEAKEPPLLTPHTLAPGSLAPTPAPKSLAKAVAVTASRSPFDISGIKTTALESARSHSGHRKTLSLDTTFSSRKQEQNTTLQLPPGYPDQLKVHDAQFRTLFPEAPAADPVLLVFRASWTPSESLSLPGRCYVTARSIFFYAHFSSLVYTSILSLEDICDVTAYAGKECDFITLHLEPESPVDSEVDKIVLKIFVEPLRLLQRRLHLLARNARSVDKLDSGELLRGLLAAETEPDNHGTGSESWEEISLPQDERLSFENSDLFKVQIRDTSFKDLQRLKLPSHPVTYEPKGMDAKPFEREFDVSTKALFHVMFGDKSAVFQTLYHERRAQDIQQEAWQPITSPSGDKLLQRKFKYQITYYNFWRRQRMAWVTDSQTIEKQDDHICYVVTDRKTPWHLPHQENFMLITKIVITHVAKSKCKLAIYTAVEWSNAPPALSKGVVQKQALRDLSLDALDLGDVVADQARKLGSKSRTKKAVDIFGQVGQEMPGACSTFELRSPRIPITHKRLSHMFLETLLSFTESALSTVLMWFFAVVREGWRVARANRVILMLFVGSVGVNMYLASKATVAFWSERRAESLLERVGVVANPIMGRAVYLRDVDEMIRNGTGLANRPEDKCYTKFLSLTSPTDLNAPLPPSPTTTMTLRLHRTRQNLGTYRHNLLVALRLVNRYERDVVKATWEDWLVEENRRCQKAMGLLATAGGGQGRGQKVLKVEEVIGQVGGELGEYCGACRGELEEVEKGGVVF